MNPIQNHGIYQEIQAERDRQEQLRDEGKFDHTCADPLNEAGRYVVLGEEIGEIAEAILEGDMANLREELIQAAAVVVAWIEGIDWKGEGHYCEVGRTAAHCETCEWAFQSSRPGDLAAAVHLHENGIGRDGRQKTARADR